MRRKKSMLWILCLVLGFLFLPAIGNAAVEGIPCTPEPTDMFINYGDLVTFFIDPIGDTDTFRFTGAIGETVSIWSTRQYGGSPCIWLYRPDGTYVTGSCPANANAVIITTTLDQTGIYTIRVGEWGTDQIIGYALDLQCIGTCVN